MATETELAREVILHGDKRTQAKNVGRPRIEITPAICLEAERLASLGLTKAQIATSLGFCRDTLRKKEKEFSGFSDAIKKGQAFGIAQVTNHLFEQSKKGNTTATIFFLKNRDPENWKDRVPERTGSDAPTPVQIIVQTIDGRIRELPTTRDPKNKSG